MVDELLYAWLATVHLKCACELSCVYIYNSSLHGLGRHVCKD
jgi:hypothetical protein